MFSARVWTVVDARWPVLSGWRPAARGLSIQQLPSGCREPREAQLGVAGSGSLQVQLRPARSAPRPPGTCTARHATRETKRLHYAAPPRRLRP